MIKTTVHDDLGICVVNPAVERLTAANATQFKEEALALMDRVFSAYPDVDAAIKALEERV